MGLLHAAGPALPGARQVGAAACCPAIVGPAQGAPALPAGCPGCCCCHVLRALAKLALLGAPLTPPVLALGAAKPLHGCSKVAGCCARAPRLHMPAPRAPACCLGGGCAGWTSCCCWGCCQGWGPCWAAGGRVAPPSASAPGPAELRGPACCSAAHPPASLGASGSMPAAAAAAAVGSLPTAAEAVRRCIFGTCRRLAAPCSREGAWLVAKQFLFRYFCIGAGSLIADYSNSMLASTAATSAC